MRRSSLTTCFVSLLATLLGGCPTPSDDPSQSASSIPPASTSSDNTNSAGTNTAAANNSNTNAAATGDCQTKPEGSPMELDVLRLVNQERAQRGLRTLTLNQTLDNQAAAYACEMINGEFFDHVNPITGSHLSDRAHQFSYDYLVIGENLAAGQTTPQQVMNDWMNSPGHAANILKPEFVEIGIAVRFGGPYGTYWVQEFGDPAPTRSPLVGPTPP